MELHRTVPVPPPVLERDWNWRRLLEGKGLLLFDQSAPVDILVVEASDVRAVYIFNGNTNPVTTIKVPDKPSSISTTATAFIIILLLLLNMISLMIPGFRVQML